VSLRRIWMAVLVALAGARAEAASAVRERLPLVDDWRFLKGDVADGQSVTLDDSGWRRLDLPHDWGIEGPFDQAHPGETGKLPWWGVAWYRKRFAVPIEDRGRRLYLDVDGAMSHSTAWLNGEPLGGWPYGYASFRLDLTPAIRAGADNVLAIRLDNPPDSSRWYPGGGLYRNVWLVKTSPIHVAHWGTFVTTPTVLPRAATVQVDATVENHTGAAARLTLTTRVHELDATGTRAERAAAASRPVPLALAAGASAPATMSLSLPVPRLWSPKTPHLYVAVTTIERGGAEVDRYETVFGVRTIRFDPDRGFLLNGERVPIQGVCNHHDLGALGAAVNVRAIERQLEILKEMGANAIRTAHNPPAPELLDLADRIGLLVMDEVVDAWKAAKKPNDYSRLYDEWYEKDLRAMIQRDRNHPSVILWSTGNEVMEQRLPGGREMAARHTAIVHGADPTRPATGANNVAATGVNGYQESLDVFGYNYRIDSYPQYKQRNPSRPVLASETSSAISSRGEYFFPVSDDKTQGLADFQVSSYDLTAVSWGVIPDAQWRALEQSPFVAGEFVWTGFDYLGEPTPYSRDLTNLLNFSDPKKQEQMAAWLKEMGKIRPPSRSSYFGIVDLAGFKKDRFYLYQAHWRPDLPMAHIVPHWTWPGREGEPTPVHVYTSGDEAELFLNGRSLGRRKKGRFEYRLRWDEVRYEPGELTVVAYKDGREWARAGERTAGRAARLAMAPDRATIHADGRDLSFITVSVTDRGGVLAPRASDRVRFLVSGPGEVVATDNGDATSHEPFQSLEKRAYNGLVLAIVRAKPGAPGRITLRAEAEGLEPAETAIEAVR